MPQKNSGEKINRYALKLAQDFFSDESERTAFLECLVGKQDRLKAIVWLREKLTSFGVASPEWWPAHCSLVPPGVRLGESSHHEQGDIYVLDPSSVFEGGILQAVGKVGLVLDVCSAPGGKTMLAHTICRPEKLICNEVIGKRLGMLRSNLNRCQVLAEVKNLDPSVLAEEYAGQADLVIVDAPCSGQSVLVKGGENPGCFHPKTVQMNAMRQRRILAFSAECVAPGGWLMYSTCTYSREENEGLIGWFLERNPEFSAIEYAPYSEMRSKFAKFSCYREWPHSGYGVGGFTCLMQKLQAGTS